MPQNTLIIAIDLGTSTMTASHARVRDSVDRQGNLRRDQLGSVSHVQDWPGCIQGATGNVCVPTDLVFHRTTRQLLFWGYEAQQYLEDPYNLIPHSDIFVVETIKLLLPDPDDAKVPTAASARHRAKREVLTATLGKQPDEVFEDSLSTVLNHILENAKRKYSIGLHNHQIELVLAFPSGWPDQIHTTVARIGARALEKAIVVHELRHINFGIEHVYTVSETLCGVKEWLRETVAEYSSASAEFDPQTVNLDELKVGDCFLPVDIGGGTGCLTPLKLVSKNPLGVEQLDKTQSLEVSGEAVQAEFENWLRPQITDIDFPEDKERLLYQICRRFKEEKKKCGTAPRVGSKTWNFPVPGLKANPSKGFEKDCMRLDRQDLEKCFDPVIDILELAIEVTMRKYPSIKAIVFLGQFGGNSAYLQKRMARHPISRQVKLRHSQSGKMDVVKGAMSERLTLEETFVRKFITLRSYGTLVTLVYGDVAAKIFPHPQRNGAVPFELAKDGLRLKVIEWAISKETVVQDGRARDVGKDGRRHHTWPPQENDLGFIDIIVISDEDVPPPQLDGKSYTLWTEAHEKNQVYISGERKHVQQIPFCWDLNMSQKFDHEGHIVGPYETSDLEIVLFPKKKVKHRRRQNLRFLLYDLIWEITEMQVKVYVRASFPNQIGPSSFQLAKEQPLRADEKTVTGESRSKGLDKDIEIAHGHVEDEGEYASQDEGHEVQPDTRQFGSLQTINRPAEEPQRQLAAESSNSEAHQRTIPREQRPTTAQNRDRQAQAQWESQVQPRQSYFKKAKHDLQVKQSLVSSSVLRPTETSQGLPQDTAQSLVAASSSSNDKTDGRRRDGCFTCKDRKKKCDTAVIFDETSGTQKCNTCLRLGIPCYMTPRECGHDPAEREIQQQERRRLIKLGKRRSRDDSESSRERSMTVQAVNSQMLVRSIETMMEGG